jgi:hypothetical protein
MPIGYYAPGPDADYLGTYMRSAIAVQQYRDEQKAQAIRWQGAQEYDTLVKSGVAPQDALSRTAPKLFFNEPRALAGAAGDIGMGRGQIYTDPDSGRQFIIQPNQKIQAVPQAPTGWTTVTGPNNQTYRIPLTPGETAEAPRVSMPPTPPQVVPLPGQQGSMIVGPRGTGQRIPVDPTELVTIKDKVTGVERKLSRAEYALEQARQAAAPLLSEFAANAAEIQASNVKPTWDWIPGVEAYTNKQARIEELLKQKDLDPQGKPLPGSRLAREIGAETAEPIPQQQAPAPPPAALGQPGPALPAMPARPNLRYLNYNWGQPGAIPSPGQVAPIAPPVTPLPAAAPRVGVSLAPNEVLMRVGNNLVVFDKNTRKALRYAQ